MLTLLTSSISLDSAINLFQLQSYQEERETFLFLWALVQSTRDGWSCGQMAVSPQNQASGSSRGALDQGNYSWLTFSSLFLEISHQWQVDLGRLVLWFCCWLKRVKSISHIYAALSGLLYTSVGQAKVMAVHLKCVTFQSRFFICILAPKYHFIINIDV